jgi:hypothetical protein
MKESNIESKCAPEPEWDELDSEEEGGGYVVGGGGSRKCRDLNETDCWKYGDEDCSWCDVEGSTGNARCMKTDNMDSKCERRSRGNNPTKSQKMTPKEREEWLARRNNYLTRDIFHLN